MNYLLRFEKFLQDHPGLISPVSVMFSDKNLLDDHATGIWELNENRMQLTFGKEWGFELTHAVDYTIPGIYGGRWFSTGFGMPPAECFALFFTK